MSSNSCWYYFWCLLFLSVSRSVTWLLILKLSTKAMLWLMSDFDGSFVEGYSIYSWVHKKSASEWYISYYEAYAILFKRKESGLRQTKVFCWRTNYVRKFGRFSNILDQIRLIFFRYCCRTCTFIQYYKTPRGNELKWKYWKFQDLNNPETIIYQIVIVLLIPSVQMSDPKFKFYTFHLETKIKSESDL